MTGSAIDLATMARLTASARRFLKKMEMLERRYDSLSGAKLSEEPGDAKELAEAKFAKVEHRLKGD